MASEERYFGRYKGVTASICRKLLLALTFPATLCFAVQSNYRLSCAEQFSIISGNEFQMRRSLGEYLNEFGETYYQDLKKLNSGSHLIDMGCGEATCILEFATVENTEATSKFSPWSQDKEKELTTNSMDSKPKITGITYKFNDSNVIGVVKKGSVKIFRGRLVEEIPAQEMGKADLITDFYGPMAYGQVDSVIRKYLSVLNQNGITYIYLGHFNDLDSAVQIQIKGQTIPLSHWGVYIDLCNRLFQRKLILVFAIKKGPTNEKTNIKTPGSCAV